MDVAGALAVAAFAMGVTATLSTLGGTTGGDVLRFRIDEV
jgi:hypothetical protein